LDPEEYMDAEFFCENKLYTVWLNPKDRANKTNDEVDELRKRKLRSQHPPYAELQNDPEQGIVTNLAGKPLKVIQHAGVIPRAAVSSSVKKAKAAAFKKKRVEKGAIVRDRELAKELLEKAANMSKDEVEIPMNRGRSAKSVKTVDTPKAASPKPGSSRTTVYARKSSPPKTASTSVARRSSKRILFAEEPEEVVSNKKAKKRGLSG
jgi:hypothetical protein